MDEKVHFFSTEQSLKRRTRILAKAIFLQRKIRQVQKMQNEIEKIRESARIHQSFYSSIQ